MEIKKITVDGLEGKTLEVAQAFNGLVDNYSELEKKSINPEELKSLQTKFTEFEGKEVKDYAVEVKSLQDAFKELEVEVKKA